MTASIAALALSLAGALGAAEPTGPAPKASPPAAKTAPKPTAASEPAEEAPITKLPVLTHFVEAPYPERARADKLEAVVVLEIDVDENGKVEEARVVGPSASPGYGFEEAALTAVAQFVFEPAEAGGKPVPVRITYKYGFTLAKAPLPEAAPPPPVPVVNFEGRLVERGTRVPLPGVRVTVFRDGGEGFEALSDAQGTFRFFDLGAGAWKVLVEADGYYPFRTTETVVKGERLEATYHVERTSYNPYDVLVEAQRPRKEVTRRTIEVAEIEKIPGSFGDAVSVVSNMPSVARPPAGSGLLIVRGSSPEDTRIAVAGVDVPLMFHFGDFRSVVPTAVIDSVDFYPGNFSPYYGRAIGGYLDVKLKHLEPEHATGYLDLTVIDSSVYAATPVGDDAAVAVGFRRSYLDLVLNAVIPSDSTTSFSTAPRYYDMQVLTSWRPSRTQRVEAFFFGADDRMVIVSKAPSDGLVQLKSSSFGVGTKFYRGIVNHTWTPSGGFENEVTLAIGNDGVIQDVGAQFQMDMNLWVGQARERARVTMGDRLALVAGIDWMVAHWDATVRSQGFAPPQEGDPQQVFTDRILQTKINRWNDYPAGYVEAEWKPTDRLLVVPGLRVDWFDGTRELTADPRLTVRWGLTDQLLAKAAVGLFHQEPTGDQLDIGFGNPALQTERALHYSLGAEYRPLPHISIDVTGFYKDMWNMVGRSDAMITRNGALVPEVYNNGAKGRVYGADVLVRHELFENFFGWIAYTLSRSERRDPGSTSWRLFDFDQTHIFTALASYKLPRNWEVGLRWRYVTGKPYTPITGAVFDSNLDAFVATTGPTNSARMGAFHQLDLRIDKRWVYDGWMLNAYVDMQNAYNRTNPEAYTYRYDYAQKEVAGGLPVLPIFGLRAEF
jgi:TonB family protein